jgi:hypothetical protein
VAWTVSIASLVSVNGSIDYGKTTPRGYQASIEATPQLPSLSSQMYSFPEKNWDGKKGLLYTPTVAQHAPCPVSGQVGGGLPLGKFIFLGACLRLNKMLWMYGLSDGERWLKKSKLCSLTIATMNL